VIKYFAHDRWFSPGTPASSTTKNGRYDIAEILLKVALKTKNQIKSNPPSCIGDLTQFWLSCLGPLIFLLPKANTILWLFNILVLSVPDGGLFRKAPYTY